MLLSGCMDRPCSRSDWAGDEWFSPGLSACYWRGETIEMYEYQMDFVLFLLWLFCYQRLRLRSPSTPIPDLTTPRPSSSEGPVKRRIPRKSHPYCTHLILITVFVPLLSQQDLSPGPLSALCCAPLVEDVLVYCLHDLVKYVYMNDDRLVSTHMIIITLSYWKKKDVIL